VHWSPYPAHNSFPTRHHKGLTLGRSPLQCVTLQHVTHRELAMSNQKKPALSDLENKVMVVIWQQGQATAEDARIQLEEDGPLKDSTIRTILRRLEEKGYVKHHTEGRTYVYSPAVESQNVAAEAVQSIVQRFCNGSVEDLLVGMVDSEVVSAEKLRDLALKIARVKDKAKSKTRRRKGN